MKSLGKQEATGTVRVRQARTARGSAAGDRRRSAAAAPPQGARETRVWKATNDTPKISGARLDAAGGGDELDDDDVSAELELASNGAQSVQVRSAVEGLKRHRATFNASIFPEGGFGSEDAAYDALGPAVEQERRVTGALRLYAKGELDTDRVLEEIARCRHRYATQLAKR